MEFGDPFIEWHSPTHKREQARSYLDSLGDAERHTARTIADQLDSAPAPLAPTLAIIPVAAHQEAEIIGHTIDQYGRQQTKQPFTVVLGFNAPASAASSAEVDACLDAYHQAALRNPHLDTRASLTLYDTPPTIGRIRRDLWNGALQLAVQQNFAGQEDIIGLNHDADLVTLPTRYIASVQQYMNRPYMRARALPAYTQSRHDPDSRFPNTSRAVLWYDLVCSKREAGYEASAVIPLSYYAQEGGFDPMKQTHEVGSFVDGSRAPRLIRTGYLRTSSRRFIHRLQQPEVTFDTVWTNDTFTQDDQCRDDRHIAELSDITPDRLSQLVRDRLVIDTELFLVDRFDSYNNQLDHAISFGEMLPPTAAQETALQKRFAQAQIALVKRALIHCVQLPDLAANLEDILYQESPFGKLYLEPRRA